MQSYNRLQSDITLPLSDFGELQKRYNAMTLSDRASAVLADAEPALNIAEQILASLEKNEKTKQLFDSLRKNVALTGKMRPSEAKNMLMDSTNDFIETTRHKLAVWRKTMERIASGEGVIKDKNNKKEYVSGHLPIAVSITGLAATVGYLSIIQLAIMELSKMESKIAGRHLMDVAKIRRCSTYISDCELAASIGASVN